jgi:hypothetical protein
MGILDRFLKRNKEQIVIPNQYYNPATEDFEVAHGSNGASLVSLAGRNARKPFVRTVLSMQGQTIAAGGSLTVNL